MKTFNPADLSNREVYHLLTGAITPRPIAFASTISGDGQVNLSPYSFFNVFGPNPPTLVFSPVRRGRDNTAKDTLNNVEETHEVVINIVSFDMVHQMSLSSTEYGPEVDEFIKSGLTPLPSEKVRPPRVAESRAQFECAVNDIIPLGKSGGAGNLVICEVVCMHMAEEILDKSGKIDPWQLDAVGRLGGSRYVRVQDKAIFDVPRPGSETGIGVDRIPDHIRYSEVLSGNDLGVLGNVPRLPDQESVARVSEELGLTNFTAGSGDRKDAMKALHQLAKGFLEKGDVATAWKILLHEIN